MLLGDPTIGLRRRNWHGRFGLRHVGGIHLARDRYRSPSELLATSEDCRDELLVNRDAVAGRSLNLREKELLRVLPDLGSMRAKREPQSDEVRLWGANA